jgi:antirestriction protein ArdC
MKNETIKEITSKAIEQLIAALNEGRSEALASYLTAMAKFHRYSLRNVMLIAMQKPTTTHVAGFHAWHKFGRFVKKGEKGILIIAPVVRRKQTTEAQEPEATEERSAVAFRGAYVFDITQTDGQALPEIASVEGDPNDNLARLKALVAEQGVALEYSEGIAPARGTSAGGKITLLPGQAPAEEFATLVHELAHLCGVEIYVALASDHPEIRAARQRRTPHNWVKGCSGTPSLLGCCAMPCPYV